MARPLIVEAFAYHAWATEALLSSCRLLPPAPLDRPVPGTFGTVMTTLRHVVEGDRFQLWAAGAAVQMLDASHMTFEELLSAAKDNELAWAAFLAVHKARQAGHVTEGSVLGSDAFFPFRDGVDQAAEAGVRAIVQPGGSVRDPEVIEAAF